MDLQELAQSTDVTVRCEVATIDDLPADTLSNLIADPSWVVRWLAARHPAAPREAATEVLMDLCFEDAADRDGQQVPMGTEMMRAMVASNPSTPPDVLLHLADDEDELVVDLVAANPATPWEVVLDLIASGGIELEIAAANPVSSPQLLAELARADDDRVRSIVLANPATPAEVRAALQRDGVVPESRDQVSLNPELAQRAASRPGFGRFREDALANDPGDSTPAQYRKRGQDDHWEVGSVGPGGGLIFFDAGSRRSWGRYLEAAPATWSWSDPNMRGTSAVWLEHETVLALPGAGEDALDSIPELIAVEAGFRWLGSGRDNSWYALDLAGAAARAALMTAGYQGGGFRDWFLPSYDELLAMICSGFQIDGEPSDWLWTDCWSSSWCQPEGWVEGLPLWSGLEIFSYSDSECYLWPIRAF